MEDSILYKYLTEGKSVSVNKMKEIMKIHSEITKNVSGWEDELYFRALMIYYSVFGEYKGDFKTLKKIVEELKRRGGWNEL